MESPWYYFCWLSWVSTNSKSSLRQLWLCKQCWSNSNHWWRCCSGKIHSVWTRHRNITSEHTRERYGCPTACMCSNAKWVFSWWAFFVKRTGFSRGGKSHSNGHCWSIRDTWIPHVEQNNEYYRSGQRVPNRGSYQSAEWVGLQTNRHTKTMQICTFCFWRRFSRVSASTCVG